MYVSAIHITFNWKKHGHECSVSSNLGCFSKRSA